MAASKPQGDFAEYRQLILTELKRLNDGVEAVRAKMDLMVSIDIGSLKGELAVLKAEFKLKSGVWGFVAGAVPGIAASLYVVLHK
jgi:hypothetical protein